MEEDLPEEEMEQGSHSDGHTVHAEIEPLSPSKQMPQKRGEEEEEEEEAADGRKSDREMQEGLRNRRHASAERDQSNGNVSASDPTKIEGGASVFIFWAYFAGIVSSITLFVVAISYLSPNHEKAEFLSMPPDLRLHYGKGKMIKLQIGAARESIQVFVREEGPRDAETVVLVHGLGSSSFSFRQVMSRLSSAGIRAVALDLPGSGFSDKSSLQEDQKWPGFVGRVRDVYLQIKEKGLFWGFDHLVETGDLPLIQYDVRVSRSQQVLRYGADDLGQSLEQVVENLALGPLHLVLHDTGLEPGAVWAANNPSLVRSITLIDAAPHRPSVPLWVLKVPGLRELVTHLPLALQSLLKMCCSRNIEKAVAEAHGILLRTRDGRRAVVEIGSRANSSFDLAAWADAENMRQVPMQILWASDWSNDWQKQGHRIAQLLPRAVFLSHRGGRWPQLLILMAWKGLISLKEDAPEAIAESIASFISALPTTVRSLTEDPLPEHVQRMFDELNGDHHHSYSDFDSHGHPHHHGHHHEEHEHSYDGGYMDGYGLGHGEWY